jgi:hypothetical protein
VRVAEGAVDWAKVRFAVNKKESMRAKTTVASRVAASIRNLVRNRTNLIANLDTEAP